MVERLAILLLVLFVPVACGDDTGTGGSGAGGQDLVVASGAGVGGQAEGCTSGDTLPCQCRDGNAGIKLCTANQLGETYFASCSLNGNPC